jgi:hypothetical protein
LNQSLAGDPDESYIMDQSQVHWGDETMIQFGIRLDEDAKINEMLPVF